MNDINEIVQIQRKGWDKMPKLNYVCEALGLMPGTLNLLVAPGCSCKTFTAMLLGLCVSDAIPFLGHEVFAGPVLHVDQEHSMQMTEMRYERMAAGLDTDIRQLFRKKLAHRIDDGKSGAASFQELRHEVKDKGIKLIIIDSLKAVTCCDESSSEIERPMRMIQEIAEETNACVLMIHHMGKSAGSSRATGRGSSAIFDVATTQLDQTLKGGVASIYAAKNRNNSQIADISYRLIDAGKQVPEFRTTEKLLFEPVKASVSEAKAVAREIRLVELLAEKGKVNYTELKDFFASQGVADQVIDRAKENGLITDTGGKPRFFALALEDNSIFKKAKKE